MSCINFPISNDHFRCPICMEDFTDPVTISCGHNYCKACITRYWDTSDACFCPTCRKTFRKRPKLSINTFIAQMAEGFKNQKLKEEYEAKTEAEIQQMIRERQEKIHETMCSLELSRKDACAVSGVSTQVFTALISSVQRSQAEFNGTIEEEQKTKEQQAEGIITELKREVTQLEKRISELQQRSLTGERHLTSTDDTHPPTKDWTKVNVHPASLMGTVRTALSQVEKTLGGDIKKQLCDVELRRAQQYEVDVTLDPDTANSWLILSEDGKQVSDNNVWQNLPDNTKRFHPWIAVLGRQSISSGRFYYEVQVGGKTSWGLGVVRESISRKNGYTLRPDNGYWTITLRNGNRYIAHADPLVPLSVREVKRVGVFVDYEEGLVSFYDVEARAHLYSFTGCSFTERLLPYFSPETSFERLGRNTAPLIISPVNMGH